MTPVAALREAVAVLQASGRDGALRVAAALRQMEAAGTDFERAMGLRRHGGAGAWRRAEALRRRNELLQRVHRDFFLGESVGTAAKAIVERMPRRMGQRSAPRNEMGRLLDEVVSIGLEHFLKPLGVSGVRRVLREQERLEIHVLECTRPE